MRFIDDYLLYLLARASAQASNEFHRHLTGQGISVPDWRIMAVLHDSDGYTIGELARHCLFKQPTLTRAVERLERKGLAERNGDGEDRRRVLVRLTANGHECVTGLIEQARAHEEKLLSGYSRSDAVRLKQVLTTLIERTQ